MIAPAAVAAIVAPAPAIRFAPPAGMPLDVVTVERRTAHGRTERFEMRHRILFSRLGAGWRMDATLIDYSTDATGRRAGAYEAAMHPFMGVTAAVAVSASGMPVSALDADAAWAKIAQGQRAAAAAIVRSGVPAAAAKAIEAYFEAIAGLTGEARDAMLTAFAWDLLALSAPSLRPGERQAYDGTAAIAGGLPVAEHGITAYDRRQGDEAWFSLEAEADPAEVMRAAALLADRIGAVAARAAAPTRVARHDVYVVDIGTGLIRRSLSRRETYTGAVPTEQVERTITVAPTR